MQYVTADEAVKWVKSGDRIFLHGSAATPGSLINALVERHQELENVEFVAVSTHGNGRFAEYQYKKSFYINSLFVSPNVREAVNNDMGDYVPVFLSEIPRLFNEKRLTLDVALVHVSPPDRHGFCSLGTSVDVARAAVMNAKIVIAQVNPKMPRTHGDGLIPLSKINFAVQCNDDLPEVDYSASAGPESEKIGQLIAELIPDGATLQMGIGSIPDAVLRSLTHHKNIGIHTEMFSDGVIPMVEKGVINNSMKKIHNGKIVTGFIMGTRKLYDFVDDNTGVVFLDISFVNDPGIIRMNPKVMAINSAIEVDFTGQVCADSIGTYQYSGVGGQIDFMRGAALSEGGKPIVALPSVTGKGVSRIVPMLKPGAGVVTTRAHVHYVITEYGAVDLFGKNMEQRAKAMIDIAHPNHREELDRAFFERFKKGKSTAAKS